MSHTHLVLIFSILFYTDITLLFDLQISNS
ncbi:hypothetical protein AYI70_g5839, partial [Smittium culicis]